jgi:large subunit ribosomal protein L22
METGIKPRRSVIKRQKKDAAKLAKAQGATTAKLVDVPTSTRKMRLVADLIRGKKVNEALPILKFQAKQGARRLEKLLLVAISDWTNKNSSVNIEDSLIAPELLVKKVEAEPKKEEKVDKKTKSTPAATAEKKETKKSTKKTDK